MADSTVRVRFAPSPTGALHLGGARTALFNWLHARHTGGRFLLRIEDTDKERSTDESTRTILEALEYLGMDVDEEIVSQSSRIEEHRRALQKLIDEGRVYKCYCTPEERKQMREQALAAGRTTQYDGRCDGEPEQDGKPFVWRFRMPREGTTVVEDMVQGRVVTPNTELEDIVIARSDGSPLYNFVVVIDDAAMGITHVVRGKDHLTNTPKQVRIYEALGYPVPRFAHLPLILGLSKRLRSAGIESYRDDGYLPEAINNYIARLGWSHGDQEVFGAEELVELFDLADVNRSEGKLNMEKMTWLNQQHIQRAAPSRLAALTAPFLEEQGLRVDPEDPKLVSGCISRQKKARTLREMAEGVKFYFVADEALEYEEKSVDKQLGGENRGRMAAIADALEALGDWTEEALHEAVLAFCAARELKLKHVAQPCRVSLTGSQTGPGLFEMMAALGRESTLARLRRAAKLEA